MVDSKPCGSFAFIGHVSGGKSTTVGRLLFECGAVSARSIQKFEEEAQCLGRASSKYAWELDKRMDERVRGISINVAYRRLETMQFVYTLIDVPGHRKYVKNAICGVSQADVGVLVVSAATGEFEISIGKEGQAREHPLLAFTAGVKQIICCINKMDEVSVKWSQTRFEEVKRETIDYLRKVGFNLTNTPFIPVSALNGDNIVQRSENMPWYSEATLLEALGRIALPRRVTEKPLRIPVQKVYHIPGIGTVAVGRVEYGELQSSQLVTLSPSLISTEVRSTEVFYTYVPSVSAGNIIGMNLRSITPSKVRRGMIISDAKNDPAKECASFTAQVIILNHPGVIRVGYTPTLHIHSASVPCRLADIVSKIDRRTGKVTEERPKGLETSNAAICIFSPMKSVCVECFANYPALGRFSLRDMNVTVAVGIVKEVTKVDLSSEDFRELRVLLKEERLTAP